MNNEISFIEMSKPLSKSFMSKLLLVDVISSCAELSLRTVNFTALYNLLPASQRQESLLSLITLLGRILFTTIDAFQLLIVVLSVLSICVIAMVRDKIPYYEENRITLLKTYHRLDKPEVLDYKSYLNSNDFFLFNFLTFLIWDQICKLNKFNQTVVGDVPLVEVIGCNFNQYIKFSAIQLVVALIFCII